MLLSSSSLRLGSCTCAAAAALWVLSCKGRNPNPGFLRRSSKSFLSIARIPDLSNPGPRLLRSQLLQGREASKETSSAAKDSMESLALVVVSFYKFADFPDHTEMRAPLKLLCEDLGFACMLICSSLADTLQRVSGWIILAPEGINGSICGTPESVEKVMEFIRSDDRLKGLRQVESPVTPEDEAIHHGHTSQSPLGGGILKFSRVYHLEGGILKYLEEVPKEESLWEGECFVFDKRVSVEHGLAQVYFKLCYGCKQPVSDADMESAEWEYGVSCPYCFSSKSEKKEWARARQRQFETWGLIGRPDKGGWSPMRSHSGTNSI